MGAYLNKPVTEKISEEEDANKLKAGSSSMQGWRVSQEDAHNCLIKFDETSNTALFGVYDGHGGAEVAQYTAKHFPDHLRLNSNYKEGKLDTALEEAFLSFDAHLLEERVLKVLKEIAGTEEDEEEDEGAEQEEQKEEAMSLEEEGTLPIEEVLKRYANVKLQQLRKAQTGNFKSPAVRPKKDKEEEDEENGEEVPEEKDVKVKLDDKLVNGHKDDEKKEEDSACAAAGDSSSAGPSSAVGSSAAVGSSSSVAAGSSSSSAEVAGSSSAKATKASGSSSKDDAGDGDDEEDEDFKADEEEEDDEDGDSEELGSEDTDSDDDDEEGARPWEDGEGDDEEDEDDEEGEIMMGAGEEPGFDSGCTAVVALLRDNELHVANAGDSRCVVCRDGKAIDMSVDHKPEDELEMKRIVKAGGKVTMDGRVNGGLNLSRAIGDHSYKKNKDLELKEQMISSLPDVKALTLEEGDSYMVLACDGIWNVMSSQDVCSFVSDRINETNRSLSSIAEELFDFCLAPDTTGDGTGCDNMTCVIVKFDAGSITTTGGAKRRASNGTAEGPENASQTKKAKTDNDGD